MEDQKTSNLPNALVIGPMKAGTSWIHDYLQSRGDVVLPNGVKETFYFDRRYEKGTDWYESHFRSRERMAQEFVIEVAPSYFHCVNAPERVKATLGEIPLVVTLRDPVRRSWSHYLHLKRYGRTRAPLQEAAIMYPEIIEASRYRACLERWYALFPKDDIHIVWQDLLKNSSDAFAMEVCSALGVKASAVPETLKGASNEAALPTSYVLATMGSAVTRSLRRMGLYSVVNGAKRAGLKRLFFGKPGSASGIEPTAEELNWLKEQLADEMPPEAEAARQNQVA